LRRRSSTRCAASGASAVVALTGAADALTRRCFRARWGLPAAQHRRARAAALDASRSHRPAAAPTVSGSVISWRRESRRRGRVARRLWRMSGPRAALHEAVTRSAHAGGPASRCSCHATATVGDRVAARVSRCRNAWWLSHKARIRPGRLRRSRGATELHRV
jgi:hypothetical protein